MRTTASITSLSTGPASTSTSTSTTTGTILLLPAGWGCGGCDRRPPFAPSSAAIAALLLLLRSGGAASSLVPPVRLVGSRRSRPFAAPRSKAPGGVFVGAAMPVLTRSSSYSATVVAAAVIVPPSPVTSTTALRARRRGDAGCDGGDPDAVPSTPAAEAAGGAPPPATPPPRKRRLVRRVTPDSGVGGDDESGVGHPRPAGGAEGGGDRVKKAKAKPRTGGGRKPSPASSPATKKSPPTDWLATYRLVEELRRDRTAPVDSDGASALPERDVHPEMYRFQILVALMLSSQTKDAVVGEAMRDLQRHGLTVENIRATSADELNALIRKVGFHNNKTKYLKQTADILHADFNGDIPPTADEMISRLPGVGPKMAYIVESIAWGRVTGIGVDTHMHRIFNALGWVDSKTPEATRRQLEAWLPRERWGEVNVLWVGFGQECQQQKGKALAKALRCSRPVEALRLVKRVGLDYHKEAARYGLVEEVRLALSGGVAENDEGE